ncbi:N-methyl-L-tryptophan oxidase [Cohnella suwonensis]|uniref:N-methyl-L-tryptophan oxidase n=1 Tax=Cohnella suwonensis TaxID=696072 RepID=A0ABW0LZ39_9BACL
MRQLYDVIVVGAGSMGMSAGYELAKRGMRTLLIDAFDPPHDKGSHHGEPRLIRHAYGGGPTYVKLAIRADERWRELEEETGEKLLVRSGVLNVADPDVYKFGVRFGDAEDHGVRIEALDAEEIRHRWPGVRVPDRYRAMYEPDAGYLYSEKCVSAYRRLAKESGARILTDTFVTGIHAGAAFVTVSTKDVTYTASHVVLSAGAWYRSFASLIDAPIRAVRKVVGWFEPNGSAADGAYDAGTFPGFTFGDASGGYYGFPSIGGAGVKIGRHDGGIPWEPGEPFAPFGAYPDDEADLRLALETFLPAAAGKLMRGTACKYELTPDDDFLIDVHPEYPNIVLAGGFSGHGFKFASAIGELIADRIEYGRWGRDLSIFSFGRFAGQGHSRTGARTGT